MNEIKRDELKRMIDQGEDFAFLNVLPEESYEDAHIPGSLNIPFDDDDEDFVRQAAEVIGDKNAPVIAYCAHLECPASENAANALEKAGYTNVRTYKGGMKDWQEASYPVEGEAADEGGFVGVQKDSKPTQPQGGRQ